MRVAGNGSSGRPDWRDWPSEPTAERPLGAARDAVRDGDWAEAAAAFLLQSTLTTGSAETAHLAHCAAISATLRLGDKVEELIATLREVSARQVESNEDLRADIRRVV